MKEALFKTGFFLFCGAEGQRSSNRSDSLVGATWNQRDYMHVIEDIAVPL